MDNSIVFNIPDFNPGILVEFRKDFGKLTEYAVAIVICKEGDQAYIGSCGFDAHIAGSFEAILDMGIILSGRIFADQTVIGSICMAKKESKYYLAIEINSNGAIVELFQEDIDELVNLFNLVGGTCHATTTH
ncbi:MAG: hypothetical protein JNL77_08785 [Nitrosomonas sp.]|nr:hypothetical protein [Nitrosomonas sp.]